MATGDPRPVASPLLPARSLGRVFSFRIGTHLVLILESPSTVPTNCWRMPMLMILR